MIDQKLYCETFSRLHASEEAKKEVFRMKENRNKRAKMPKLLRTAAVAAVMACALAVTAGAVNLATDGALFATLREVWSDGYETRYEAVDEAGNLMDIAVMAGSTVTEDNGRLILHAAGEDIDITGELTDDGAYHFEKVTEHRTVVVDIAGTPENWTLTERVTDENGVTYNTAYTSEDQVDDVNIATAVIAEGPGGDGVESSVTVTTSGDMETSVTNAAEEAK
ncbi:MAG: hypothetical protein Q4C45_03990 [Oscillospiraceae bacterium]|nr:hypothetical protein [Oscillospiraceae bacterium]